MEFSKIKITSKEFVGRDEELEQILDILKKTNNGLGNFLLLAGEAGIGKTRLISELVSRNKDLDINYLRGRCKFHQGLDPYSPFIEALRSWFGINETDAVKGEDKKDFDKIGEIIRTKSPELIGIIPLIRGFISAGTSIYGSYIFKGSNIDKSFNTYKELSKQKRCGLCITRERPEDINTQYELVNSKILWLSKSRTEIPTLDPSHLERIRWAIKDFVAENNNSVVLLDGLEYLILQNNFENVLKFVELLKDDIALNDAVLILPIDPDTLEPRQMALFERYIRVISSDNKEQSICKRLPEPYEINIPGNLANGYPFRTIDMDYNAEKDKMFEAIVQLIKNITDKKPLILFLDDLHWADYSSLQLLQYLFQNTIENKILIIGSYRPEDIPVKKNFIKDISANFKKLNIQDQLTRITIDRLNKNNVKKLVKNILNQDIPDKFVNLIYKKSEGNPLYVEEIIKSLLEDKIIDLEDESWFNKLDYSKIEIPNSITEVVQMRLDRVTSGHELIEQILKYTSIIGSTFNFDILLDAMKIDEELLLDSIERLMRANIFHEVSTDIYKFDHTFIREVIYNNLSSRRRKILHAKIGHSIEKIYKHNLQEHYVQLAHHFSKGGVTEKAVDYSIKEGEFAKELCAYDESLLHYKSALEFSTSDPVFDLDKIKLINIYINLGDLSLILGTWSDAKNYFEKSFEISTESGDLDKTDEVKSKLDVIEEKKQRWSCAIEKLIEVLDIKLDAKESNTFLVSINPKYVIRANISLIEILLKSNLEGIYICINHPSYLVDKLLKVHNIPTQNLMYFDFITSLSGRTVEFTENVYLIDNAFSLDNLLKIFNIDTECSSGKVNLDIKNIDFIIVDNISNLMAYTTSENIMKFIDTLVKSIKRLTGAYGIVIMDNETNPEIRNTIEPYFDESVSIKEEWL